MPVWRRGEHMQNYVITIARGFGSGGKDIATRLGKELGIPCYERQILTMASDQSGIDESVFVETDEKLRGTYLANVLRGMPISETVEPMEKDFISDVKYLISRRILSVPWQKHRAVSLSENVRTIFSAVMRMSSACILKRPGPPV